MENKDGTRGQHWTMEQTSQFADGFNKYDFYAALNMIYSDYYNPKFDTNTYVELAKDWLCDEDAELQYGEKLSAYYESIVEGE